MVDWHIKDVLGTAPRPGYRSETLSKSEVDDWIRHLKEQGVKSIICLLKDKLAYYEALSLHPEGLLGYYRKQGLAVRHVPVEDPADMEVRPCEALSPEELEQVWEAFGQLSRPVVIHCSAMVDRSPYAAKYVAERLART